MDMKQSGLPVSLVPVTEPIYVWLYGRHIAHTWATKNI